MQLLPSSHVSAPIPSPTLTNPDLILPLDHPSPEERSFPKMKEAELDERDSRSGFRDLKLRSKHNNQSLSPFRNGILAQNEAQTRPKTSSDRGYGRIRVADTRLSYRPNGEGSSNRLPAASQSPVAGEGFEEAGLERLSESPELGEHAAHEIYKTPSILDEDENDPESHAAMTRRAEEILANAKKRLTVCGGLSDIVG